MSEISIILSVVIAVLLIGTIVRKIIRVRTRNPDLEAYMGRRSYQAGIRKIRERHGITTPSITLSRIRRESIAPAAERRGPRRLRPPQECCSVRKKRRRKNV